LGFIEKFERRLERLVNGAFSKAFKSQIQPVEIGAAIKAKLDSAAAVVGKDRILAPNIFKVRLSPTDYSRLKQLGDSLLGEIQKQVASHAKKQRYQFAGELSITVEPRQTLDWVNSKFQPVEPRLRTWPKSTGTQLWISMANVTC